MEETEFLEGTSIPFASNHLNNVENSEHFEQFTKMKSRSKENINSLNETDQGLKLTEDNLLHDLDDTLPRKWLVIFGFILLHVGAIYGFYLWITTGVMWQTVLWGVLFHGMNILGFTAGIHRHWSHKAYKAKRPLQYLLVFMQTTSAQKPVLDMTMLHRLHHKFSETNADNSNIKRGFFFAHMGWPLCEEHPAIAEKAKLMDFSDLKSDPLLRFQSKYYIPLGGIFAFALPILLPWWIWGEDFKISIFFVLLRMTFTIHALFTVNSLGHWRGRKPYDRGIYPTDNILLSWFIFGEGEHNYHHVFPWDYNTAEVGNYRYNYTTIFIDLMAKLGLAYDLKTVPSSVVKARALRTGDGGGIHHIMGETTQDQGHIYEGPWGWGDADIPNDDLQVTETLYPINRKIA